MVRNLFTAHPAQGGETYFEHLKFAGGVGGQLLLAGLAALVHAIFPFVLQTTASNMLAAVHHRVEAKRATLTGTMDMPPAG